MNEIVGIFPMPDISHKNILSREHVASIAESNISQELLNKKINLTNIDRLIFLDTYALEIPESFRVFTNLHKNNNFMENLNDLRECVFDLEENSKQNGEVSLYTLLDSLKGHLREIDKDKEGSDIDGIISTIQRIRIIKTWIGRNNLDSLKKLNLLGSEFDIKEETDCLLEVSLNQQQNAIDEAVDDQRSIIYDASEREVELYGSRAIYTDVMDNLSEINERVKRLRGVKKNFKFRKNKTI